MRTLSGGGAALALAVVLAALALHRLGGAAGRLGALDKRLAALGGGRDGGVPRPPEDSTVTRLHADVAALQARAAARIPPSPTGSATSPEQLRRQVSQAMDDLEADHRKLIAKSTADSLRSSFNQNVEHVKGALSLTPSQVEKWKTVLNEQADKARALLEGGGAGSDYDRACRDLVTETHARLGEVLDEQQKAAYLKLGVDWFGGALHSARERSKRDGH